MAPSPSLAGELFQNRQVLLSGLRGGDSQNMIFQRTELYHHYCMPLNLANELVPRRDALRDHCDEWTRAFCSEHAHCRVERTQSDLRGAPIQVFFVDPPIIS